MSKALEFFPKNGKKGFDTDKYGIDVNAPVSGKGPIPGEVGLELELESSNRLPPQITFSVGGVAWNAHADGSLRHGGLEYTLSGPCARENVEPLLFGLFDEIKKFGTRLKLSNRCSTHVHINVSQMTLNQMCSFFALWASFENVLIPWCGDERVGNLFCLRLCDAEFSVGQWAQAFKTGNFDFSNEYKYMACNPAAFNRFGSLEFRTLRGADNPEMVIKWVNCLLRLKDVALQRYDDPTTIVQDISTLGGVGFLRQVLEGLPILDEIEEVNRRNGFNMDEEIMAGFRRVQPVIYALPWSVLLPEIKKPFVPDPFGGRRAKKATTTRINIDGAINRLVQPARAAEEQADPMVALDPDNPGWVLVNGLRYNAFDRAHRGLARDRTGIVFDSTLDGGYRIYNRRVTRELLRVPPREARH